MLHVQVVILLELYSEIYPSFLHLKLYFSKIACDCNHFEKMTRHEVHQQQIKPVLNLIQKLKNNYNFNLNILNLLAGASFKSFCGVKSVITGDWK